METGGAVYAKVPAGEVAALEAAIREVRGKRFEEGPLGVVAFDPAAHAFALVDRWGRGDDLPSWAEEPDLALATELAALSRRVGEVVAFFEIEEDFGVYALWRDGELARELQWLGGAWAKVEGEAQPWEAGFFEARFLERALENVRDYNEGDEPSIRAGFEAGKLVAGSAWPRPERAAEHVRAALRGPAHGLAPWPRRRDAVKALKT